MRDQVVRCCKSKILRRKLLEKGDVLTLKETLKIAASFDAVENQFQSLKSDGQVNQPSFRKKSLKDKSMPSVDSGREYECYRCGNVGHVSSASSCPARGKTCRLCEGGDHFAKKCKTTTKGKFSSSSDMNKGKERSSAVGHIDLNQRKRRVHHVGGDSTGSDEAGDCDCQHTVCSIWYN